MAFGLLLLVAISACGAARTSRTPTPLPYIGPDAAALRVGQDVQVRMRVECVDAGARDRPTYLRATCYFEGFAFRVAVPDHLTPDLTEELRGPPESMLVDRVIDVSGIVAQNGEWAEIVLGSADQIRISPGWRPAVEPTRLPRVPRPTPTF